MSAPSTLQAGDVIESRYTLRERIEDWGVGEAWTAGDARFPDRVVVLKFLPAGESSLTELVLSRLEAVRALRHPRVLPLVDHGVFAGREFAVHEHGPLRSLGAWLDAKRAAPEGPPIATLRAVFAQVCEAIAAGHAEGPPIVHEGVSPSAVMLRDPDGDVRARVFDFAIAPFADPIEAPGGSARAVACVAPEQFQGETPDARTDQFSLGLLLLEMLAAPAAPDAPAGRYRGRGDVPEAVWQTVQRALHTARDERFESVEALSAALEKAWEQPEAAAAIAPPAAAPPAAAPEAAAVTTPEPARPVIQLYDDESVAARYQYGTAARVEEVAAPPVFVAGAHDTAPITERALPADDDVPEVGARTIALPHGPAMQGPTGRPAGFLDDDRDERTTTMPTISEEEPAESRTVTFDAAALFQDAAPDALSTMRANRDPRALMEMTRRYREEAAAAVRAPRKDTLAGPSFVRPPTRPAEPAPAPKPAEPAPAPKPPAVAAVAKPPAAPEGSRRVMTAVLSMLVAFAVALAIVFAVFRARHR